MIFGGTSREETRTGSDLGGEEIDISRRLGGQWAGYIRGKGIDGCV